MATSTAQRTGIWIIAIVLTVGTLAGFIAMILAPKNEANDSKRLQDLYAKYQTEATAVNAKKTQQETELTSQADALSAQYYNEFNAASSGRVAAYDKDAAQKKLESTDIKAGTGEVINESSTYAAYYVGWLPDGTIFDGSIENGKLKAPLVVRPGGVITGWSEAVKGMKIGGIRELTIPSDKGYGSSAQGKIPANSPLKFIVMPFKSLETIKEPEVPQELLKSYGG